MIWSSLGNNTAQSKNSYQRKIMLKLTTVSILISCKLPILALNKTIMKKALLFVFAVAAFSQAKAQQFFNVQPSDSLKNNLFEQYFNVQPQNQSPLLQPKLNLNKMPGAASPRVTVSTIDRMPVAQLQGLDKMPVAKLLGFDKMPVAKLGQTNAFKPYLKKLRP